MPIIYIYKKYISHILQFYVVKQDGTIPGTFRLIFFYSNLWMKQHDLTDNYIQIIK
jgi:hypothetical protein